MKCPRIVIAGTGSGVGKTSVSLALTAALRRRGLRVQTFKVGPDFLDPTYLAIASGRPCYNLDGWMTSPDYVRRLFARVSRDADVSVIEGVMGLFDGASPDNSSGSTAEIARFLNAPVLLVVNVHGMARSVAPLVKGYASFEDGVRIAGIIANHCGSKRHEAWLSLSLSSSSLPPIAAAVPRNAFPSLSSRHLGLVTADRSSLSNSILEELADSFERYASLEGIIKMAQEAPPLAQDSSPEPGGGEGIRLGIARDEAFHFYYRDFFDELLSAGCSLEFFSPLNDSRLPKDIDALYLGGGYPEEYAARLSNNKTMLVDVRRFAASRRPIYGECGGMMYLSQQITDRDGADYSMVGIPPAATRMLDRKSVLGYVEVELKADSLWGNKGTILRGHEFHYSELAGSPADHDAWLSVYAMKRRRTEVIVHEGFQRDSVLVSYVHLHLASRPEAIRHFISFCRKKSE
ncbi:MAG: cobyrinate a,c-diamide synthase [Syntrophales bacterium]|nr:cobyrinate a,c-diamide synthase [Syntrophales bacterium]